MKKVVLTIIASLFFIFFTFFLIGILLTNQSIKSEAEKIIKEARNHSTSSFTYAEIDSLPPVLKKYFRTNIKEGSVKPRFVRLKQEGLFRTSENSDWKELTAEQYYLTKEPAFLWNGSIKMNSLLSARGIDYYFNKEGYLSVKLLSSITVSDVEGEQISQSQLFRWISEAPWFPTSLLPNERLKWTDADSVKATANIKDGDNEVTAHFFFNENGEITKVQTYDKYRTTNVGYTTALFTGYFSNYKEVNGFRVPTSAEAEWNLDNHDFKYGKFSITDIDYDVFEMYTD